MRGSMISQNLSQLENHYYLKPKSTLWLVSGEKHPKFVHSKWEAARFPKTFPTLKITTRSPKVLYGWSQVEKHPKCVHPKREAAKFPKTFPCLKITTTYKPKSTFSLHYVQFQNNSNDFWYVDTHHDFPNIYQFLLTCFKKSGLIMPCAGLLERRGG